MREIERGRVNVRGRVFSVFVSNLPRWLDRFGLNGIFRKAGRICDVYIPTRSGRKGEGRYGFVRFRNVEDAIRSILLFHGAIVRGNRLHVMEARPKMKPKQIPQRQKGAQWVDDFRPSKRRLEWRQKGVGNFRKGDLVSSSHEDQSLRVSLVGEVNEDNEEWLSRSLVCTVVEPRDLATLSSAIMYGYDPCIKLSALSSFKFLLTFPTEERMEEALEHQTELHQWFIDVKKWGVEECCDSRKVWLDIVGVPPHGWKWENFKKIAELWGLFVSLGKPASANDSFEVMRVLIATKVLQTIDFEFILTLGSCGYRVKVTEAEMVSQVGPKCRFDDTKGKNDIPGFDDIDGSDDDGTCNGVQIQEGEESPESRASSNSNSNIVEDKEPARSNGSSQHTPSRTRTKTASFSQNGYSEELRKVSQHLKLLGKEMSHDESSQVSQPPPGFEVEHQENDSHIQLGAKSDKDDAPIVEGEEIINSHSFAIAPSDNRVSKQGQKDSNVVKASYKKALLQVPSSSTSTDSTSESLVRLAHESLKIGELLGVKVTGDFEAAVSRITKPLKKIKGKGRSALKKRSE